MPDDPLFGIINVQLTAAGLLGGLVHAIREDKTTTPKEIIRFMLVGAITANFIGPYVLSILSFVPLGFVGFGIGTSGKHICIVVEFLFNNILGKTKNE